MRALLFVIILSYIYPSQHKPVQSQENNVRTMFSERCFNVILLTLNRFWPAVYSVGNKRKQDL